MANRWTIGLAAVLLAGCASHASAKAGPTATATKARPTATAAKAGPTTVAAQITSSAACTSGQLRARFVGGGYGGGSDFGNIVAWNPGPMPCRVHGAVGITGFYPDGTKDAQVGLAHPVASHTITLPGGMAPPVDGHDLSVYLDAQLMGTERDDSSQPNALCRKQDEGTPTTLVLTIGALTIRTANSDPGSVQVTSVYGCHGQVLLEDLSGPG